MTDKKLLKYLKKSFEPPNGEQILTPVVLTDSKGKYLQAQCSLPIENSIRWWDKSGRNSKQGLKWLRDNLETEIALIGNISLYIWVGTCDLTEYNHPYIKLRQDPEEIVQSVINNFQKIAEILKNYPACKLTFFEISPYSIYEWNSRRSHPDIKQFIDQDITLVKHILQINDHIRYINNTLETRTPGFSIDLFHPVNTSKKESSRKAVDQYNFSLYKDGIHPDINLARVWLRKIAHKVKNDCW